MPTTGSLHVTGLWNIATGSNSLLGSQTQCSASFFIKVNEYAPTSTSLTLFGTLASTGCDAFTNADLTQITFRIVGGTTLQTNWTPTIGQVAHVAMSWGTSTQTIWINGVQVESQSVASDTTSATSHTFSLGLIESATGVNYQIAELAFWNGYAMTSTDALNLRDGVYTPLTLGTAATAYWPLGGTLNANPTISDAGLQDATGNGYNFTTLTGTTTNAYYDAAIPYSAPVVVTPYVARSGRAIYAFLSTNNAANTLQTVTSVQTNPTFKKNGSSLTVTGPYLTWASQNTPFATWTVASAIESTDVITYSAPDSWILAAAGPASAATNATVTNYVGVDEPGVGTFAISGVNVPVCGWSAMPSNPVQLGWDIDWSATAVNNYPISVMRNLIHRVYWSNISQKDTNGYPQVISAASTTNNNGGIYSNASDNYVDSRNYPIPTGYWQLVWDETAPSTPMTVTPNLLNASGSAEIASTSGPTAGTMTNGVAVGRTLTFNVEYTSDSPTNLAPSINLTVAGYNNSYPANWTIQNLRLIPPVVTYAPFSGNINPAQSTTSTDPYDTTTGTEVAGTFTPETNLINWCTTPNGNGPAILRFVDCMWGDDGSSTIVDAGDLRSEYEFSYTLGTTSVNITTVRNYNVSTSPNVYLTVAWPGCTTGGSGPTDYYVSPANPTYLNWGGANTSWFVGECVCSAPHGMKTGNLVTFGGSGLGSITVTNGASSTVTMQLNGLTCQAWVTGADTFAFTVFGEANGAGFTYGSGNSLPGGINNVYGSQSVTATCSYSYTDSWTIPPEPCCALTGAFPACDIWINVPAAATSACSTALATRVLNATTPGRHVVVEYGNEVWGGDASVQQSYGYGYLGLLGTGNLSRPAAYVQLAAMHHTNFYNVFSAAGRGSEIVSMISSQWSTTEWTTECVDAINSWNEANPSTPIQMDATCIAPYVDCPNDSPDPSVAPTATVTGGGSTGGTLGAGTYYFRHTETNAFGESMPSPVGIELTISAGNQPQFTFPSLQSGNMARNLYIGNEGGASTGPFYLYASGITASIYTASTNTWANALQSPPSVVSTPSIRAAWSSVYSTVSGTYCYGSPLTPWTAQMWLEYFRHWILYNTAFLGSPSYFPGYETALAAYVPVNSQSESFVPAMYTYEGALEYLNYEAHPSSLNVNAGLTHDLFYNPEILRTEYALYAMESMGGVYKANQLSLCLCRIQSSSLLVVPWGRTTWLGQPWGYGDGSDGKAVNQTYLATGAAQDVKNVSVELQAWRNWANAANGPSGGGGGSLAPTVTGIAPTSGSAGTSVAVTGTNFSSVTSVYFGSYPAASYNVNSPTSITAVSPAALAGTRDIVVTTTSGSSATSSADKFSGPTPSQPARRWFPQMSYSARLARALS